MIKINEQTEHFIDFDGVILDSQQRVIDFKNKNYNITWNQLFEILNWAKLLEEAEEIEKSIEILKIAQNYLEKISIMTKIHTLNEGIEKVKYIRSKGIHIPVYLVPPHVKKAEIFKPNPNSVLVDDRFKNIDHWEKSGGTGILFKDENSKESHVRETSSSLQYLLR